MRLKVATMQNTVQCTGGGVSFHGVVGAGGASAGPSVAGARTFSGPITCRRAVYYLSQGVRMPSRVPGDRSPFAVTKRLAGSICSEWQTCPAGFLLSVRLAR